MIKSILTNRRVTYAFQVLIFAWACASTISISLNMFLWLVNGIFLGVILYSHHIRNNIKVTDEKWIKLHYLIHKSLTLLGVVMKSYRNISKIISENVKLSDDEQDDLTAAEAELINHITTEVAEIEATALMLRTDVEADASDN